MIEEILNSCTLNKYFTNYLKEAFTSNDLLMKEKIAYVFSRK